jgi:ATP-binding cassette subfamily F protein 3
VKFGLPEYYEDADKMEKLMNRQAELQDIIDATDAWNMDSKLERAMAALNCPPGDSSVENLSGGERRRVALCRLLLQKPDVLLLDEPTNHLDIESIQWLEQFLAQSSSAVVLVSHDRAFINNVSNRTLEISCGKVIDYKVKYNEYVVLRKERREQQLRAYENQQKEVADMKAFIERFRYQATKAVQVQQKIKQLEKVVPIEIDEVDNSAMHLKFPPCLRSGDYPVICDEVRKDYGAHTVFDHVTLTIKRGEKVAFVGKNGEGKSTLVKCIMNEIPFTGELKIGHNIQIGYFAQNQAQLLDENLTVFQTIDNVAKGDIRLRIKDILGAFMFGGEESDKKVKVLSGGERSRLAMIRLLLEPVNLLILDEPTNHLDMPSKDVLKEAIKAFDGTAIIVSHDREFLDGLVTKVYEFGGGKVREHLGGIYDFLQSKKISELNELGRETNYSQAGNNVSPVREQNIPSKGTSAEQKALVQQAADKAMSYAERKEQQKRKNRAEKAVKESEAKIEKMEGRLKELDDLLMKPENASDMVLVTEYTQTKQALDEEVERWEKLSEELESINY